MTWARLDDRFHGNPKVMEAWHKCPGAVGMYVMGITYCAQHETDGFIAEGFVLMLAPQQRDRERFIGCLVDCGLWHTASGGWTVNGYLEFNPSRADLEEKRRKDSERKARGRNSESRRNPNGVHAESARPVPTRPVTEGSNPDKGSPLVATDGLYVVAGQGEAS